MALTLELKSIDNPEYYVKSNIGALNYDADFDIRTILYNIFKTMTDTLQSFKLNVVSDKHGKREEAHFLVIVDDDKMWWEATEISSQLAVMPREPQNVIEASLASLIYSRFIE